MRYTVKLYGHLSDNPERFYQQLADLLGIEAEDASALVRDVPVIVRQGLPRELAERMAAELASIHALCLIEREGNEPEPEEPAPALSTILPEAPTGLEEEPNLRPARMWLGALGGTIALILVVASIVFLSLFKRMYSENRGPSSAPAVQSPVETETAKAPPSEIELKERIANLEGRIERIRDHIKLIEDNEAWVRARGTIDLEDIRRNRQDRAKLDGELRTHVREIKQLKAALRRIEATGGAVSAE